MKSSQQHNGQPKQYDNTHTYEIGELYHKGNKVVGIVVDIKDDGKHATIMSLTSFDKNGNHKITEQKLVWKDAINGAKNYDDGWHLPSKEELETMYKSFDKIQSVLKVTKGALALNGNNNYWTSTENCPNNVYTLNVNTGNTHFNYVQYVYYVRAFLVI